LVAVPLFSNADDSLSWLYWLPLLVLITSATAVLSVFAIWRGRLNLAATSSALRGLVMAGLQVAIGFWHPSAFGLAGGHTVGSAAAGFRLAANLLNAAKSNPPSRGSIAAVAKQYSKFPKHTMPAAVLNATTLNGLPPMIGLLFGATTLGLWSLARRVIAVPLMVVGNAVGQVYYRRAAGTRESHGDSMRLYRAAAWRLALLSAPGFLVLLFTAPWVFGFVFGDEWRLAGNYAQIMIPWIWLQFVALPLSRTTLVFERNELDVKVQIAILGVVIATGVGAAIFSWTFLTYLAILSACLAIWHLALLLLYANVIREDAIGEDDEPQAPA
jgi:O-antigen/teichoic acid export membrane protein